MENTHIKFVNGERYNNIIMGKRKANVDTMSFFDFGEYIFNKDYPIHVEIWGKVPVLSSGGQVITLTPNTFIMEDGTTKEKGVFFQAKEDFVGLIRVEINCECETEQQLQIGWLGKYNQFNQIGENQNVLNLTQISVDAPIQLDAGMTFIVLLIQATIGPDIHIFPFTDGNGRWNNTITFE